MLEFLSLCFAPVNLLFTVMLIGVMFYWALFLAGVVGLDLFDADMELDADAGGHLEADVDVDTDAELVAHHAQGGGGQPAGSLFTLLRWIGIGDVPVMVMMSAIIGSLWAVSILSSYYMNPNQRWLVTLLWLVPNVIASLFLARLVTWPASYIFRRSNLGIAKPTKMLGRTCVITTSTVTGTFGQATFQDEGAPITFNVRCRDGDPPLKKGDEAIILDVIEEKGVYVVVPFELEMS